MIVIDLGHLAHGSDNVPIIVYQRSPGSGVYSPHFHATMRCEHGSGAESATVSAMRVPT